MQKKTISYFCGETALTGHLFHHPHLPEKRPGILVAHAWKGNDDYMLRQAERAAELGYVVLAADVYGNQKPIETNEEAFATLLPLFMDRELLQKRILAGYDLLVKQPEVDSTRIGAMGFCFGGLTTIELFRSGAPLKGAVSFHGLLGYQIAEHQAQKKPIAKDIKGSLLLLHGHQDPLVSAEDISQLQKELTEHHIDWQMHIYGQASHAFTNQAADEAKMGLLYNERADLRSWQAMQNFFSMVF